jgi:hypothetical protein
MKPYCEHCFLTKKIKKDSFHGDGYCSMVPYLHALHVNTELIEAFGAYC